MAARRSKRCGGAVILKNCPFCDGEAGLFDQAAGTGRIPKSGREPRCRKCGCSLGYFDTAVDATAAWNRRAEAAIAKAGEPVRETDRLVRASQWLQKRWCQRDPNTAHIRQLADYEAFLALAAPADSAWAGLCRRLLEALCGELRTDRANHQDLINEAREAVASPAPASKGTVVSEERVNAAVREWRRVHASGEAEDIHQAMRAALEAALSAVSMPGMVRGALDDITAERQRQISAEGWTIDHDDSHSEGEMACAAGIYALIAGSGATDYRNAYQGYSLNDYLQAIIDHYWPWDRKWFKPTNRRRDLVKAGALIVAEIERLDRAASPALSNGERG
jgi:hypothetical protein